jgi:5-methylcytosine-specific restriction protein B
MIDEINRGNLSKVFGELLYLLEYRNQKIRLTYSPDIDFSIPENLYLIGTMNTADRSLALVDYALRRRFSFIRLTPNYRIIKKLLSEGKSPIDVDRLVSNLEAANRHIAQIPSLGQGFEIGHSYFLKKIPFAAQDLNLVLEYELEPLLQEYFFDSPEQVDKVKAMLLEGLFS